MKWMKSVKQRRNQMISLLVLAGLIAGGWYWYASAAREPAQNAQRPMTIARGTIQEVVTSQGKLEAKQYVDVGTQVSGQIKKLMATLGTRLSKGSSLPRSIRGFINPESKPTKLG